MATIRAHHWHGSSAVVGVAATKSSCFLAFSQFWIASIKVKLKLLWDPPRHTTVPHDRFASASHCARGDLPDHLHSLRCRNAARSPLSHSALTPHARGRTGTHGRPPAVSYTPRRTQYKMTPKTSSVAIASPCCQIAVRQRRRQGAGGVDG